MNDAATNAPWCLPGETWDAVPNHLDEYEISDFGRHRSLDRSRKCANGQVRYYKGRILKGYDTNGYRTAWFPGDPAPTLIHTLVLTVFDKPRPTPEHEGLHGDGDRANNRLSNLRWGTVAENRQDAVRHRTHVGTNRSRCSRGHLFAGPNLRRRRDGTGKARHCRACGLARGATGYYRRRGVPFDVDAYADRKYAELMAGTQWADDTPCLESLPEVAPAVEPCDRRPDDIPGEHWMAIPGWEGSHEVSDHARLRSKSRWVDYSDGRRHWYRGGLMTPTSSRGYLVAGLPIRGANGRMRSQTWQLHKLVMLAFRGPTPAGLEILHGDGDGLNARLDNLRFGTHRENAADMVRHGRTARERQGDTCRHGHRLVAPNLMKWKLPTRSCLACNRARHEVRVMRHQGVDFALVAGRKYREIMGNETVEDVAARTRQRCVHGHDLAPFNLVGSRLPSLYCKACSRGKSSVRYAASHGVTLDVQKVCDEKYAELLAEREGR